MRPGDHEGEIVCLQTIARMGEDARQYPIAQGLCGVSCALGDARLEGLVLEHASLGVAGLGDAVGVHHQHVAGFPRQRALGVPAGAHVERAENRVEGLEPLQEALRGAV